VPSRDGDHLGAVRVPVEARLADHEARTVTELAGEGVEPGTEHVHAVAGEVELLTLHACGRSVLTEHVAQGSGPLPRGDPRERALDGRLHHRRAVLRGLLERGECGLDPSRVAVRLRRLELGQGVADRGLVEGEEPAVRAGQQR
jgi:hypothetical protein